MGRASMKKQARGMKDNTLHSLYYDPMQTGSLGGQRALFKAATAKQRWQNNANKLTKKDVNIWLSGQDAYTLHKPVKRRFLRRKTIVSGINDQFQADLVEMQDFKTENKGYAYILTVIDVFSKFAWALPLKTKTGKDVATALSQVFQKQTCRVLQSDFGSEFYNREVKALLEKNSVEHFSTYNNDIKASVIERWNRTLKTKLYRWFTASNSFQWVKILPKIVTTYNSSYHRTINMAPKDVNLSNQEDIWLAMYSTPMHSKKQQPLKVNDSVRISRQKFVFDKGYTKNFSSEVFIISKVLQTFPVTFKLVDQHKVPIEGSFYADELQKVVPQQTFEIEKVVRSMNIGKKKRFLIKWKGFSNRHNSWVNEEDLIG